MYNTTPIESLLSKQSGKFLSDEELFQIQNDLSFLIQENKKLTSIVDNQKNQVQAVQQVQQLQPFTNQNNTPPPNHGDLSHSPMQTHSHSAMPSSSSSIQSSSPDGSTHPIPSDVKTITIVIDTNKLVYLLLFIIIMIIILKK